MIATPASAASILKPESPAATEDGIGAGLSLAPAPRALAGQTAAAPIPEPETWAMVIGGLALIGLAGRRRTARRAVVTA